MSKSKKYVSDFVGDSYKNWKHENIILDCGTGTGKTSFCIEILGKYAQEHHKKILYLINRCPLEDDIKRAIEENGLNDTFTVLTYQKVEEEIKKGNSIPYEDYLIADECHYFLSDAYTRRTYHSYTYVKRATNHSTVIYMSATAKPLFESLVRMNRVKKADTT